MIHCIKFLWVVILFLHVIRGKEMKANEAKEWKISALANSTAELPCLLDPRTPHDKPKLILWYKKFIKYPVISYDGRLPHLLKDLSEGKRSLNLTEESATLVLKEVTLENAGLYECRVDFFKSPTHTSSSNLTVIEPVREMKIEDQTGRLPSNGTLGPFIEGKKLLLLCTTKEGKPTPNITWWKGEELLSNNTETLSTGETRNTFAILNLDRSWNNASLTCKASNTNLTTPLSANVKLQMFLYPKSVEIIPAPVTLEGKTLGLRCSSQGSYPPASLTWSINGEKKPAEKENTQYGEVTTSTLVLKVDRKYNNAKVVCTAKNREAPNLSLSNYTTLHVEYPPSITASLGRSLEKAPLKEGDDVYFSCKIDANPPVSLIQWFHEDELQVQNVSEGTILSGDSLVLQKVSRFKVGRYRCRGSNHLATEESNWVHLKLRYKPECQTPPTTFFLYDKPINVSCAVSAYPPVTKLFWKFNGSKETSDAPIVNSGPRDGSKFLRQDRSEGIFSVSPTGGFEDRELFCYGVNELGMQTVPCKFSIKVARMPAPLSACRLANITASSLNLTCEQPIKPNFGPTSYRAEVYLENGTLYYNVSSREPSFNVSRLDPATNYQIKVYVSRGPVTSPPVVVSAYTSRSSPRRDEDYSGRDYLRTKKGVIAVSATLLFLLVCVFVVRLYYKRRKRKNQKRRAKNEGDSTPQGRERKSSSEDTNPDVVPHIEETYDLLSALGSKSEAPVFNIIKEPTTESFTLRALSHSDIYQPLTSRRSSSIEGSSSCGRTPSTIDRRSIIERPIIERHQDVYCTVDQIFNAEESVV